MSRRELVSKLEEENLNEKWSLDRWKKKSLIERGLLTKKKKVSSSVRI